MPKSSWSIFPVLFIIAGFFLLGAMGLFIYSVVEVHRAEGLAGKVWPAPDNHKVLWKTYRSSAYSFMYPVGMKYLHPEGSAVVGSLDDSKARDWYQNMIVGSQENLPILTVLVMKDQVGFRTALEQANIKYYSKTSELINGTKFDKYTATGTPYNQSEYIYTTDDGTNYFLITLTSYSAELTALAQKMLLSFEISAPMADLQTYTNSQYHYSFKYRQDWKITPEDGNGFISVGPIANDQAGGVGVPHIEISLSAKIDTESEIVSKDAAVINGVTVFHQREKPFGVVDSYYFPYKGQYIVVRWEIGFADYIPKYKEILESFIVK